MDERIEKAKYECQECFGSTLVIKAVYRKTGQDSIKIVAWVCQNCWDKLTDKERGLLKEEYGEKKGGFGQK